MRISAKAEYACLALIDLARSELRGAPRRVREIAEAQEIPERYLVQILLQLKAAGLVQSTRGSFGGYRLFGNGSDVTVADVVAAIDGPGDPPRQFPSTEARGLAILLERAHLARWNILSGTSLAQLANGSLEPDDYVI